ncbi:alpha/beta hydrolase [Candidatus Woesearchaeota archaeon]|nr:alpha/beta hydrolase [Candidatus Woesearchaeota archaeon]
MKLWLKIAMVVLATLILLYALGINAEYYLTATRSVLIDKTVEEVPGHALADTHPIILLHGFNPTYSGRISELLLKPLQEGLVEELNYTDKGIYTKKMTCTELLYEKKPFVLRMTYLEQYDLVDIDAYSENLARTIEHVLDCTGAESVDLVAHSMGGIVARIYILEKLAAEENPRINKLVMLGTPNHGGLYNIGGLTGLLIEDGEPKVDLDFVSLSEDNNFMQKLNEGDETPGETKYYTIAGDIDDKGDGLILKESVPVEGSGGDFMVSCEHNMLKFPQTCPEAMNFVVEVIQE